MRLANDKVNCASIYTYLHLYVFLHCTVTVYSLMSINYGYWRAGVGQWAVLCLSLDRLNFIRWTSIYLHLYERRLSDEKSGIFCSKLGNAQRSIRRVT